MKFNISEPDLELAEIIPTTATQGETYNGDEENSGAAHAIDKDFTTFSSTHADNGQGWLKVELGKNHFIHKVVVYHQFFNNWYFSEGYCTENANNFKFCIDDHNNVDVSVFKGEVQQKSCGTIKLTYELEQSDQIYAMICNVAGDSVKLYRPPKGNMAFIEVVIIGKG